MFNVASFASFMVVTAISPGPNNILSMSLASRLGLRKSLPFNAGILVGFTLVMGFCTLFASALYSLLPRLKLGMQIVGAAYMLYLAYQMHKPANTEDVYAKSGFVSGMLLQFVNPKEYLYGITAMSTHILPHFSTAGVLLVFAFLLALTGFLCTILWALFGAAFKKTFVKHGRIIQWAMTALLVYCAISLFL